MCPQGSCTTTCTCSTHTRGSVCAPRAAAPPPAHAARTHEVVCAPRAAAPPPAHATSSYFSPIRPLCSRLLYLKTLNILKNPQPPKTLVHQTTIFNNNKLIIKGHSLRRACLYLRPLKTLNPLKPSPECSRLRWHALPHHYLTTCLVLQTPPACSTSPLPHHYLTTCLTTASPLPHHHLTTCLTTCLVVQTPPACSTLPLSMP